MPGEASFPIDDLIHSVTSQLDQVQDALAVKALNRPLTYALRELTLNLQVFVEMDAEGKVRIRPSGPNEAGASAMHLSFTTVTRSMIEENTISLAAVRSPTLDELGFERGEREKLSRLGIRTAAQLRRVGASTGVRAISQLSDVAPERLRNALNLSRPAVDAVRPVRELKPPVESKPPVTRPPDIVRPQRPELREPPPRITVKTPQPRIELPADAKRVRVAGRNLIGDAGPAIVRLNNRPLALSDLDDDGLVVDLPDEIGDGLLDVELPDGSVASYQLSVAGDPWRSGGEGSR